VHIHQAVETEEDNPAEEGSLVEAGNLVEAGSPVVEGNLAEVGNLAGVGAPERSLAHLNLQNRNENYSQFSKMYLLGLFNGRDNNNITVD